MVQVFPPFGNDCNYWQFREEKLGTCFAAVNRSFMLWAKSIIGNIYSSILSIMIYNQLRK